MKKLPMGISNYEKLIDENYYYVDKTKYIEKLENFSNPTVIFLRPRKFGKTLFTSVLENYYDILKKDKFETLFKETYIGKNPTKLKNSYHILRFNFSGINTKTEETTIKSFKNSVTIAIQDFVNNYNLDFTVNLEQEAEDMLKSIFVAFKYQKPREKIYVIIDEYDYFTNEILTFNKEKFKEMVSRNGQIRKWYEVLKQGTETIVDRIFITGVMPITLDSMTSGFNIATDITRDVEFNNMVGFCKEEIIKMMEEQKLTKEEQEKILPIMKENYDGYRFSISADTQMYNSNMSLYFLSNYVRLGRIPENLIDVNIASDYSKLSNMLMLCTSEQKKQIIEKSILEEPIISTITDKFNPEIGYGDQEMISMLFYLGYLTIEGERLGKPELKIPNHVMKELYASYFLESVNEETNLRISGFTYNDMLEELAYSGKIDKVISTLKEYLNNLSNRDYMNFDEKYVKVLFYSIVMNLKDLYVVKSEYEVKRKYPDLLLVPKERTKGYNSVMIEFKYLKKEEAGKLEEKQKEARKQIQEYGELEEMKNIENLNKYTVVAVVDEIYVEKI